MYSGRLVLEQIIHLQKKREELCFTGDKSSRYEGRSHQPYLLL